MIFTDDLGYCDKVYATTYMVSEWGIDCDWSITIYEICMTLSLVFYIRATIGAIDLANVVDQNREVEEICRAAEESHKRILEEQMDRST